MFKKSLSITILVAMLISALSMAVFASEDPATFIQVNDGSELTTASDISVLAMTASPNLEASAAETAQQDIFQVTEEEVLLETDSLNTVPVISFSQKNPLYEYNENTLVEQDAAVLASAIDGTGEDITYASSLEEAAKVVREAMKARKTNFTLYWRRDEVLSTSSQIREVFTSALIHTGVPTEGDYLRWSYIRFDTNAYGEVKDGIYYYTLPCVVSYYTTADQEAVVTDEVDKVIADLGLPRYSDYETLRAIYDYICDTVTYDYTHLEDNTYTLKYSAYAALINKTAVCQGYASLFYRLALESGVDCRMIAGRGNNANHGWVIAKLGTLYYNLDPTWDAEEAEYSYFLRGSTDFGDHSAFDEYLSTSFTSTYSLSDTMYVFKVVGDVDGSSSIDMQDVVRLLRFIAGWDVEIDTFTSDANEDGETDLRDCIILLRYLAEWTDGIYHVGTRI